MNYLSVCSGIEAATMAWHPLGWRPWGFSEIEKFPSAVLAHHYPDVPNFGDMTKFKEWPDAAINVLVGGTPCQSFSVAGLRQGMADPRGNLALTYLAIADRYRPEWLVWENVPGVLSSDGGRDFGSILGAMAKLGYGFAYRVLDAQFVRVDGFGRAVPQRRRRVFVVGYLGDWRRAAAVLFEPESLFGHSAPRRETGKTVAGTIRASAARRGGIQDESGPGSLVASTGDVAHCLNAGGMGRQDYETETMIAMREVQAIAFDCKASGQSGFGVGDVASTMRAMGHANSHQNGGGHQAVAFAQNQRDEIRVMNVAGALAAEPGMKQQTYVSVDWAVRRLTPVECERLQGFPDNFTNIPWRNKNCVPDGPRYKSLGNSMAVNVMRWIGTRIQMVESM